MWCGPWPLLHSDLYCSNQSETLAGKNDYGAKRKRTFGPDCKRKPVTSCVNAYWARRRPVEANQRLGQDAGPCRGGNSVCKHLAIAATERAGHNGHATDGDYVQNVQYIHSRRRPRCAAGYSLSKLAWSLR